MYSSLLFYILYWPFIIGVKKFRVIFDSMDHSVPPRIILRFRYRNTKIVAHLSFEKWATVGAMRISTSLRLRIRQPVWATLQWQIHQCQP
jgi:hypothetical protein